MNGFFKVAGACAVLASTAAFAAPASATTYNAYTDFSQTSPVWSYGSGTTGTSFTAFTDFYTDDPGDSCSVTSDHVTCAEISPGGLPEVAKITGTTVDSGSDVLVANALYMHPGASTDAIIQFTAPRAGSYYVSGFFETLDIEPQAAGDTLTVVAGGTTELSTVLKDEPASFPDQVGGVVPFSFTISLATGQTIDFGVNDNGSFGNNGTGFDATIVVPEPSTWAMLLIGLAGVGTALRGSSKRRPLGSPA
jgi:hypothetical protein